MKKYALAKRDTEILARYGLMNVPADKCIGVHYEQGETITQEGSRIGFLAFVTRGMAKIYRTSSDGRNLILCYYLSDGMIGEVELLKRRTEAATTVKAVSEIDCILVDYQYCANEINHNTAFLLQIGTALVDKLMDSDENYVRCALGTAEERLCVYILRNSPYGTFHDVLSDVAGSIGTSYRHVFRLLSDLCRERVLQKDEAGYQILDKEKLAAKAKL